MEIIQGHASLSACYFTKLLTSFGILMKTVKLR